MQSAFIYLFPFRNESDFSIENGVEKLQLFPFCFELEMFLYSVSFSHANLYFFLLFFFNLFSFMMPLFDLSKKWSIIDLRKARRIKRASRIKGTNQKSCTQSLEGHHTGIPQFSLQIHTKKDGHSDFGRGATPSTDVPS